MSETRTETEVAEAEEWYRKHWEFTMQTLSDTLEREARISEGLCTISDERKAGQAEAYRAAALAVIKTSTRRMYLFPEPWIGYSAPMEARP